MEGGGDAEGHELPRNVAPPSRRLSRRHLAAAATREIEDALATAGETPALL
jgi:hypothetical protein